MLLGYWFFSNLYMHCTSFSETNQEKIVEAGGLASLLMLLSNSDDETIHRVSAGAIANLAMNGNFSCLLFEGAFLLEYNSC